MADYEDLHRRYAPQIKALSYRQRIPGMDPDDIASEMSITLWRAYETFDPDSSSAFGTYWWSLWLNRRSDLAKAYFVAKRARTILMASVPDVPYRDPLHLEPPTGDPVEALVWRLLAEGESGKDIRMLTEMGRRRYHRLLSGWKTDDIRDSLLGA